MIELEILVDDLYERVRDLKEDIHPSEMTDYDYGYVHAYEEIIKLIQDRINE